MLIDSLELVIRLALERNFPGATEVAILDVRSRYEERETLDHLVRVRWTVEGLTRVDQFIARVVSADEAVQDEALLTALVTHGVPAPRILLVENREIGAYVVRQYVPGDSMSQILTDASMRWELSAHGFTFARSLARIHNIGWRTVVPWMGDAEALPEDLIADQLDNWFEDWQERSTRCPEQYRGDVEAGLTWIDARRPTDVSVCLCHGDFRPANIIVADDEVAVITGWGHALVTDASYDLCLLPFEVRQMSLPDDDADLLTQAIFGAYLQSSNRSLGNLQFYAVARLLSAGLRALDPEIESPDQLGVYSTDVDTLFGAMRQAMSADGKAFWKA